MIEQHFQQNRHDAILGRQWAVPSQNPYSQSGQFENILRSTASHFGAPLTPIANVAQAEGFNDPRPLAPGALANPAPPITCETDGLAGLGACRHGFNLSALRARLMSGGIIVSGPTVAGLTYSLAGLGACGDPFQPTANHALLVSGTVFTMAFPTDRPPCCDRFLRQLTQKVTEPDS